MAKHITVLVFPPSYSAARSQSTKRERERDREGGEGGEGAAYQIPAPLSGRHIPPPGSEAQGERVGAYRGTLVCRSANHTHTHTRTHTRTHTSHQKEILSNVEINLTSHLTFVRNERTCVACACACACVACCVCVLVCVWKNT